MSRLAPLACLVLTASCTITTDVEPLPAGTRASRIYLKQNDSVHMEGLHPALVNQIENLGFPVSTVRGAFGPSMKYRATYSANWYWDMAMYLQYFRLEIRDRDQAGLLAWAEYDARQGSGNMNKFGATEEKIQPLLAELFSLASPGEATEPEPPAAEPEAPSE
jgi:hypothetical protein